MTDLTSRRTIKLTIKTFKFTKLKNSQGRCYYLRMICAGIYFSYVDKTKITGGGKFIFSGKSLHLLCRVLEGQEKISYATSKGLT